MWLLGKENLESLKPVLNSKYYTDWVNYLKKFLKYSRQSRYYNNPYNLLALQIAFAKTIAGIEAVITEGKRQLRIAKDKKDEKRVKDIEIGITSNRQITRIIKTIADGLAWRVLDFDRPFMRVMAEPQKYPGSVALGSKEYEKLEEKAIVITATRKSRMLLNDLTYFLRIGDLTEVGKKTIIWESKKSGRQFKSVYTVFRKGKSQKLSQQMKKLVHAQVVRDFREIPLGSNSVIIMDLPFKFDNYLNEVASVIKEAREKFFSTRQLSECLIVSCTDQEQMINHAIKTKEHIWEKFDDKHKWNNKDSITAYSNLDSFYDKGGDFFRTSTPYSVYPFNNDDVMGLMSGKLFLKSQLNMTEVKRMFIKAKWNVIDRDVDKALKSMERVIPKIRSGKHPHAYIDDTIFTIKRGPFNLKIPMYWVTRIATEFMKPEVLLKHAEAIYQTSVLGKSRKVQPFILGEKEVWR